MKRAIDTKCNYENFSAKCPYCDQWNTFNRVSDLKTTELIDNKDVTCFNAACQKQFSIGNDSVNLPSEQFMVEAKKCIVAKKYMIASLLSTQAIEMLMYLAIKVIFAYIPFAKHKNIKTLNESLKAIEKKSKHYTFNKLAYELLHILINKEEIDSIEGAIPEKFLKENGKPSKKEIEKIDKKYALLSKWLNDSNINVLRNQVIHKKAYRPNHEEAEETYAQSIQCIKLIKKYLEINSDDINYYNFKHRYNK